jgi:phosphohistidine phosphatase
MLDNRLVEIYLLRHGIAEEPEDAAHAGRRDPERRLTAEGLVKTRKVAASFRRRVSGISVIIHSPYVRARETAEIFAQEFPDAELVISSLLVPMGRVRDALDLLRNFPEEAKVMLVGHEPHLSCLASLLISGHENPIVEFRKAGIARIEWDRENHGCLIALLPPKFLL